MDQRGGQHGGDGMSQGNNLQQQQGMQQQASQQQRMPQMMTAPGMMMQHDANGAASGNVGMTQQQHAGNTSAPCAPMTAPMMMNLMTNPALAAAAAASPLFPPAAMLSNPSAFLAMPEAFAMAGAMNPAAAVAASQQQNTTGQVTMASSMPMMGANTNYDASEMSNNNQNAQQQQQQGLSNNNGHTPIVPSMTPLAPYGLPQPQNGAPGSATTVSVPSLQTGGAGGLAPATTNSEKEKKGRPTRADLTAEEKAKQNRDRNREHARSTRLRKKAYVQKLKELVECLHAERTEEVRQRRVAIQHLAEKQNVRRSVVRNFLRFRTTCETDHRKWATLLEDDFWLKQPVTPYRSFRRSEIEQECRISKGIEAMICDSASVGVMIEGVGSRSSRWMQIKREEFTALEAKHRGNSKKMPRCIQKQDSRLQHAVSSLSSSSGGSSNQFSSSGEDSSKRVGKPAATRVSSTKPDPNAQGNAAAKVSSSSGSSNESRKNASGTSNKDFHDYHAKPLADPKMNDSEQDESPEESNGSSADTKRISTDSSSGDDSAGAAAGPRAAKKRKVDHLPSGGGSDGSASLPPNIAKKGGIGHSVRPEKMPAATSIPGNGNSRLSMAPAVALPPFAGIGKKRSSNPARVAPVVASAVVNNRNPTILENGNSSNNNQGFSNSTRGEDHQGSKLGDHHQPAIISADAAESSSRSDSDDSKIPQIRAQFHLNEDDMILMEDILMCPFVFRSHNAVLCGALSECVMPGMLRAHFSERNKLQSMELVYDAMGFMQQLERASGNEGTAQIIPGSLEMALTPSTTDALVITLSKPPYLIVNVNDVWTRVTGYTQMEVEGREYLTLLEGEGTVPAAAERPGKPRHKLEEVARGRCACSTNIHYDKEGRDFIEFVSSYPLTNAANEVTHLLHVSKELPSPQEAMCVDTSS
eukprot:CAMPEP_0172441226 /NCGR_PEP_ID=MMETSP1065-20121228/1796_1 /TAXON_ID=265537 /ORGANISM="Amphiprora paludosa, Strain CCMP125" /LENGTH=923 /DNA_ID=CAMNT_0013190481 /DNA_START=110 /DNA_END=2881 /DNA_ORIENTATION=+